MTFSDAALAAALERRHWVCMPREGRRPLWVLVAFGKFRRAPNFDPFVPSVAEATSDLWRVSPKGPRTSAPRRKSSSTT